MISQALTAAANTVASLPIPDHVQNVSVLSRTGAGEVFMTVDGTTPVIGGPNQFKRSRLQRDGSLS